jgi:hypothetical protein
MSATEEACEYCGGDPIHKLLTREDGGIAMCSGGDVKVLRRELVAVRAPLEARIAELESALASRTVALDTLERVKALREAAEVCDATIWKGSYLGGLARDAILALIEAPAVKP